MHGHLNVNLSRCTVSWTSIYHDARSPERQFITMHGQLNVKLINSDICSFLNTCQRLTQWLPISIQFMETDCLLEVSMHPDGPAAGQLNQHIPWFSPDPREMPIWNTNSVLRFVHIGYLSLCELLNFHPNATGPALSNGS